MALAWQWWPKLRRCQCDREVRIAKSQIFYTFENLRKKHLFPKIDISILMNRSITSIHGRDILQLCGGAWLAISRLAPYGAHDSSVHICSYMLIVLMCQSEANLISGTKLRPLLIQISKVKEHNHMVWVQCTVDSGYKYTKFEQLKVVFCLL